MNKVQREVKEILKHSVLWTLYFVAILAVALVAITVMSAYFADKKTPPNRRCNKFDRQVKNKYRKYRFCHRELDKTLR